jgi:predicted metal-dependent phosphoesterase TrpH
MGIKVDLHCHSIFSDGKLLVEEIQQIAVRQGIKALSITDHDTLEGARHFLALPHVDGLWRIPGIEINTGMEDEESYHIIGLFVSTEKTTNLHEKLLELKIIREKRLEKMVEILRGLVYNISMEEIKKRPEAGKGSVGRPIIARILVEKKYFFSIREVFDKLINPGRAAYVPRKKILTKEAIQLILDAKGVPILAHPFHGFSSWSKLKEDIERMVDWGLRGIEYYYDYEGYYIDGVSPSKKYNKDLLKLMKKFDLLSSGGSDFHGDRGRLGEIIMPKDEFCKLIKGKMPDLEEQGRCQKD